MPPGLRSLSPVAIGSGIVTFVAALALVVMVELPSIGVGLDYWLLTLLIITISFTISANCLMAALRHSRLEFLSDRLRLWQGAWLVPRKEGWPSLLRAATIVKSAALSRLIRIEEKKAIALRIKGQEKIVFRGCCISVDTDGQVFSFGHGLRPQEPCQIRKIIALFLLDASQLTLDDTAKITGCERAELLKTVE